MVQVKFYLVLHGLSKTIRCCILRECIRWGWLGPSKIGFDFWLIFHWFSLLFGKSSCFLLYQWISFIPYWESLHTHTHCMSWVIYLKFLSAGKFVLIKYLTLIYISAYFCNAIWLFYQLIIHACSEANFREKIFFANFPQVSDFQCEASGRT